MEGIEMHVQAIKVNQLWKVSTDKYTSYAPTIQQACSILFQLINTEAMDEGYPIEFPGNIRILH